MASYALAEETQNLDSIHTDSQIRKLTEDLCRQAAETEHHRAAAERHYKQVITLIAFTLCGADECLLANLSPCMYD